MTEYRPDIPGYEVQAEIGRGGMGVVYRVRRRADDTVLALKMILHNRGASFAELARFRIEAEALACLNHPNIVKIRDVGLYGGYPYFALEFAERGSLKQAIARGPHPPRPAAELVRTLASAMQHAHERGMLHRDLKPANVLLMGDGTPKVTDFGLVKFADPIRKVSEMHCTFSVDLLDRELSRFSRELGAQYHPVTDAACAGEDEITRIAWQQCAARTGVLEDEARFRTVEQFLNKAREQSPHPPPDLDGLTKAGAVMGSPNYMAPEQATGDFAAIGPRTDVYALGGILYELLTGQPPFRADSLFDLLSQACSSPPVPPRQLAPDVPPGIEAVCLKCLEKSPDRRYQSASELAEDLLRFLGGQKPQAARRKWWPFKSLARATPFRDGEVHATQSWWPFGTSRTKSGGRSSEPRGGS